MFRLKDYLFHSEQHTDSIFHYQHKCLMLFKVPFVSETVIKYQRKISRESSDVYSVQVRKKITKLNFASKKCPYLFPAFLVDNCAQLFDQSVWDV